MQTAATHLDGRRLTEPPRPPRRAAQLAAIVVALVTAGTSSTTTTSPASAATIPPPPGPSGAVVPDRVLDTRAGTGATAGRLGVGTTLRLDVPATRGDGVVVLNLTAVDALDPGYVSVWPCDADPPGTSVLNVEPGRAVPNTVVVERSPSGVCLQASAPMHLVADTMATFDADALDPVAQTRLLDTRPTGRPVDGDEVRAVAVPGGIGRPFAVVNVTAVEPGADGFVTVAPCPLLAADPLRPPATSSLNFRAGETVAATTLVATQAGELCVRASTRTHLLVDVFALGSGGDVHAAPPARALDTRSDAEGPLAHAGTRRVRLAGRAGVPNDASAAVITATAIGAAPGHVSLWPCDAPRPDTSVLNTWPGSVRANTAVVELSRAQGETCAGAWTVDGSPVELLVDVTGWVDGDVVRDPPPDEPPVGPGPADPGAGQRFTTLPPGSELPSGTECAARVRPTPEIRPGNAVPNATRGTAPNGRYPRVDGDFVGTTDEILQWAACKWGIDEDVVRAQIVKESWWNQSAVGDGGESFGLGQVRVPYHQEAFAFDDAIRSSAYNVDYTYAGWRSCYEGNETWLNQFERGADYGPGDLWGCLGVWFTGRWWVPDVDTYLNGGPTDGYGDLGVREHLERRTWEHPDFLNG